MTTRIGADSNRKYRTEIDGLRAIAVLSVFFFHLQPEMVPGGFLGVDIFFVISGYLITGIILRENLLGTFSFGNFYARRIKRIFPALFVVIVLSAIVAIVLLTPDTYFNFMKSGRYASAQLANIFFARDVGYFEEGFSAQPLLHTWSLGVEEQYYLFWPLLLYFCFWVFTRRGALADETKNSDAKSIFISDVPFAQEGAKTAAPKYASQGRLASVFILLALISYGLCFYLAEANQKLAFYMFYTRAWEFFIGGLVTLAIIPEAKTKLVRNATGLAGLLILGYSFLFVSQDYFGQSFLRFGVILPCIGTALILHNSRGDCLTGKLLSLNLVTAIGKISYSLYLYHWPIIIFYKLYTDTHEISFLASLSILALAFILATFSYYFVERPARKAKLPDRRAIFYAVFAIISFSIAFKILEAYELAPWRITAYEKDVISFAAYDPSDCHTRIVNEVALHECEVTEEPNAPTVALVGDSHANNYFQSTVAWAKINGFNVVGLTIPGCPMLLGDVRIRSKIAPDHEPQCKRALPLFASRIMKDPDIKLILIAQRFDLFFDGISPPKYSRQIHFIDEDGNTIRDHTDYYRNQFSYTVKKIREAGKEPIILKQVPLFKNVNACQWEPLIKKILSRGRDCSYETNFIEKWQKPSIDFIDQFAATHQLKAYDPAPYLDSPLQEESSIYKDLDHLNNYGIHFLIPDFVASMNKIVKSLEKEGRITGATHP